MLSLTRCVQYNGVRSHGVLSCDRWQRRCWRLSSCCRALASSTAAPPACPRSCACFILTFYLQSKVLQADLPCFCSALHCSPRAMRRSSFALFITLLALCVCCSFALTLHLCPVGLVLASQNMIMTGEALVAGRQHGVHDAAWYVLIPRQSLLPALNIHSLFATPSS